MEPAADPNRAMGAIRYPTPCELTVKVNGQAFDVTEGAPA